jgi:hypothetical protein
MSFNLVLLLNSDTLPIPKIDKFISGLFKLFVFKQAEIILMGVTKCELQTSKLGNKKCIPAT